MNLSGWRHMAFTADCRKPFSLRACCKETIPPPKVMTLLRALGLRWRANWTRPTLTWLWVSLMCRINDARNRLAMKLDSGPKKLESVTWSIKGSKVRDRVALSSVYDWLTSEISTFRMIAAAGIRLVSRSYNGPSLRCSKSSLALWTWSETCCPKANLRSCLSVWMWFSTRQRIFDWSS